MAQHTQGRVVRYLPLTAMRMRASVAHGAAARVSVIAVLYRNKGLTHRKAVTMMAMPH